MSIEMNIEGIEELERDLKKVINAFPDTTKKVLKKNANAMKRKAKEQMESDIKKHTHNIIASRWGTKALNSNVDQTVMIYNKAPHAHLVEFGHAEYDFHGNPTGGFVEGTHSLEKVKNEYEDILPDEYKKMIDELLGGNGL